VAPEERRLVSVLFCDLAGFTTRSDQADPEDVRGTLMPFHEAAKREIERFGGTLDKFIGDAAMGVFGAPVAHEDDAVRAVEAGLAILDAVAEQRASRPEVALAARAAVATGEAVVRFGTGPQIGEAVAGDVVNTASRLQSVAPEGAVVVEDVTFRALRGRGLTAHLGSVSVKGKAQPLGVWRVDEVVAAETPGRSTSEQPPLVGRDGELAALAGVWERVIGDRSGVGVAIVADAGLGKTRLVAELQRSVAGDAGGPRWLWGRCPPYGEGVTFAALEQAVREAIGATLETTDDEIHALLADATATLPGAEEDAAWIATHLGRLLGVGDAGVPVRREESFTAWIRFLVDLARAAPTVLVVEDIHWADEPLLDLLADVVAAADEVPLLVLLTARPELAERRASWRDDGVLTWFDLRPLGGSSVAELMASVAPVAVGRLDEERRETVLDAAGGNPLYAVEFARMLRDDEGSVTTVPDSVQAVIGSRLDTLSLEVRAVLHDAAVVGRTFWPGAIEAIQPDRPGATVAASLDVLVRRGFVVDAADEAPAYGFSHALVREVAYSRLTRPERLRRHRATADWLAAEGSRLPDAVELAAHHRREALRLARAMDDPDLDRITVEARGAFVAAGDLARRVDLPRAVALFADALDLMPEDDPERPWLLTQATWVARRGSEIGPDEARARFEEAIRLATAAGNMVIAAEALTDMAMTLAVDGRTEDAREVLDRAITMYGGLPPNPMSARAYLVRAEDHDFAGQMDEALPWIEKGLEVLGKLPGTGLVPPRPPDEPLVVTMVEHTTMALHLRGDVRCVKGDLEGGLADLRLALDLSTRTSNAMAEINSLSYLQEWLGMIEGPSAALPLNDRCLRLSEQRGFVRTSYWMRVERLWTIADLERWDEVRSECEALLEVGGEATGIMTRSAARLYLLRALLARDELDRAAEVERDTIADAREVEHMQVVVPVLSAVAELRSRRDDPDGAVTAVEEVVEATREDGLIYRMLSSPDLVRSCVRAGRPDVAARVLDGLESSLPRPAASLASAGAELASSTQAPGSVIDAWEAARRAWEPMGPSRELSIALAALERTRGTAGQPGASLR
jgi:class 3 adenylate cyclase/tetratricopeptide (TPR) repeat protein